MARHAVWTRVIHRSGLERPHFRCHEKRGGRSSPHVRYDARRGAKGNRYVASHPEELRASREVWMLRPRDLRHLRNRARCGSFHAVRPIGSVLLSLNVGVMRRGLRPTGRDGRANTRLTENAELQRHNNNRSIGHILTWKKLSVLNQKQRTCRRKKCLSRTWILRDLENPSFRASERK